MHKVGRLLLVVLAMALMAAAGCGDDDGDGALIRRRGVDVEGNVLGVERDGRRALGERDRQRDERQPPGTGSCSTASEPALSLAARAVLVLRAV
mgnify:CR=1 FL=1